MNNFFKKYFSPRAFFGALKPRIRDRKKKGIKAFTLIEILVTISIIGILAGLIFVGTQSALANSRDARRKGEISQIKKSLQAYYNANKTYPTTTASGISLEYDSDNNLGFTQEMKGGGYMSAIPRDPKYSVDPDTYTYKYIATTTDYYTLCSKSESKDGYICVTESTAPALAASAPVFGAWGGGATCGETINFGGLAYGTVTGPDGKCWMDRNLGATRVATATNDPLSYGYYYQWGRAGDGHQISNSGATSINADSDIPGHANFITEDTSPYDWRVPQSPNAATLWAGTNGGSNNPCPTGWHVPTLSEWETVSGYFSSQTAASGFTSFLKLPFAGYRSFVGPTIISQGSASLYWSSSPSGTDASILYFCQVTECPAFPYNRAFGFPVRCVKD